MCRKHFGYKDEERDKREGDEDENKDDGVTRRCDNEGGMRKKNEVRKKERNEKDEQDDSQCGCIDKKRSTLKGGCTNLAECYATLQGRRRTCCL